MLRRKHIALLLLGLGLGLGLALGCAALPWPQPKRPPVATPVNGYVDLRGVVHVHTRASHDSPGKMGDVIQGARDAGVSWIAFTEHTKPGGDGSWGEVEGVTLIPGYEMKVWGGSLFLLGIDSLPKSREPKKMVDEVHAAGGAAFVGHLERSQVDAEAFRQAGVDGIEIINLHANARAAGLHLVAGILFLPGPLALRKVIRNPTENLARWEELPTRAIVGGVDAHAKLRVLGPVGGTVDPYARTFRVLTTHVLARDSSRLAILEGLREGRTYVAWEALARVDAFGFRRRGDAFELEAPRKARLALVCDGVEVDFAEAERASLHPPAGAKRCRAEAWLGDRLWILTSYSQIDPT